MSKKLIWQPDGVYQPKSLAILLDREFAKKMLDSEVSEERKRQLNKLANTLLFDGKDIPRTYFLYEENSGLVTQVNADSGRGTWLHIGREGIDSLRDPDKKDPVRYTDHNIDHDSDIIRLLRLFDFWVQYSKHLIEK